MRRSARRRAEIFVPEPTPGEAERIASYGAVVVRTGATYCRGAGGAPGAPGARRARWRCMPMTTRTFWPARARSGGRLSRMRRTDPPAGGGRRRRADRRDRRLVCGRAKVVTVEPELCPALHDALPAGPTGARPGRRGCGGQPRRATGRRPDVRFARRLRRRRCWCRTRDPRRATGPVGPAAPDRRTRRRDGACRPACGAWVPPREPAWALSCAVQRGPGDDPHECFT